VILTYLSMHDNQQLDQQNVCLLTLYMSCSSPKALSLTTLAKGL